MKRLLLIALLTPFIVHSQQNSIIYANGKQYNEQKLLQIKDSLTACKSVFHIANVNELDSMKNSLEGQYWIDDATGEIKYCLIVPNYFKLYLPSAEFETFAKIVLIKKPL